MKTDPVRALALISVAVANAPAYERVWIEDIYQNIYCGAAQGIRKQATGIVADWRTRYGRKPDTQDDTGLGALNVQAPRTCGNGEPVLYDMSTRCSIRYDFGGRRRIAAGSGGTSRRSRGGRYLYQGLVRHRPARHRRQRQRAGLQRPDRKVPATHPVKIATTWQKASWPSGNTRIEWSRPPRRGCGCEWRFVEQPLPTTIA